MDNLVAKGFIEIGEAVRVRGEDYKEAEKYFKQALEVAQKNKARRNEALALVSLGGLHITLHDADQGLDYITKALPFYEQGGYRRDASLALNQLGRGYDLKGDYDAALEAFERGLEIAKQVEDQSYLALSHRGIGNVLAHREQFPTALEHYQASRAIYTSLGNELNKARSLMNLADVFWRLGLYNDAQTALREAIAIAERPNDKNSQMLARIEMIRTSIALSERHMSDAETLARRALRLNAATGHAPEAKYLLGLAQSYSGKTRQGRLTCEQAVNMAIAEKDPRIRLGAMLAYASALLEGSDSYEALKTSLEAESMSGNASQRESQWCALLIAARASKLAGNEMTAHDYASQAQAVLGHLRQEWGDTAYESYVARPDIKYSLNQLDQILAQPK
jgi:tetratricopeptide (TPR) repeat protein